jgi:DNA-binding beta-propeller fold protein YncE
MGFRWTSGRRALLLAPILVVVAAAVAAGYAVLHRNAAPRAPFVPRTVAVTAQPSLLTPSAEAPRAASTRVGALRPYEYVFPPGEIDVFDIDHAQRLVERMKTSLVGAVRGVVASPRTHSLYFAVGGDGDGNGTGSLVKIDLLTNRVVWEKRFPTGVDSAAITPDGRKLYLPTGEAASYDVWYVVDARTGRVTGEIHGGTSPHNTIVAPDGKHVYLAPRNARYLVVADTRTDRVVRRIGPFRSGVRPFTIDGAQRIAYVTTTGYLGFQVASISTGKVLYTEGFEGFGWDPKTFVPTAPSHGISLSPDSRQLWVIDAPNSYVHVFDVSRVPAREPRPVADVKLAHRLAGQEVGCDYDCYRDGWLQHSLDGRFVYVGDSGDVIDTRTRRPVAFLAPLANTREMLEIDWRHGVPVATSTRSSVGYR